MTDILTHNGVVLTTEYVRDLLDSPSNEYVSDETIDKVVKRVYNWCGDNTSLGGVSNESVRDAVFAISVWQLYGIYVESISQYFKQQDPKMIEDKLANFKEIAILYARNIGIVWPLDRFGVPTSEDVTQTNVHYAFSGVAGTLTMNDIYDSD